MFNDVGDKIKSASKTVAFTCGGISTIIGGYVIVQGIKLKANMDIAKPFFIKGLIIIALGILFSYIASLLIEGFGEMVSCQRDRADSAEQELKYKKQIAQSLEGIRQLLEEKKDKNEF